MRVALTLALCIALLPSLAFGEPPPNPLSSFAKAKIVARDVIYADHKKDFYCGCDYTRNKTGTSGVIDTSKCGYTPRKNKARGKILEWEHVMPAAVFGRHLVCWSEGHTHCVKSDGTTFKGRTCCAKADETFQKMEADLHNLAPAVGELNGDRSDKPYGIVAGEPREYGACNFEIGGNPKVVEPPDNVKGDAARIWLYMSSAYGVKLTTAQRKMFDEWSMGDPVDSWERLRDTRVWAAQGNRNPFVK